MRAALVLVGLLACGDDRGDAAHVAAKIRGALAADKGLELAAFTCRSQAGGAFACTGKTADGQAVTVDVTPKGSGNFQWQLHGNVLHAARVRSEILPKVGSGYELRCPHDAMVVDVGAWTRCTISKDGQIDHLDVRIDDDQGNASYRVEN